MPPLPPPRPILLTATLYLVIKAQAVKQQGILRTWDDLKALKWPDSHFQPADIHKAVLFVCSLAGKLGLLNSCLVRSLVAGRLLANHSDVRLLIGINTAAPNHAPQPTGHAWVEVSGVNISDPLGQEIPQNLRVTHSINLSAKE